jgi:hypothetical protein
VDLAFEAQRLEEVAAQVLLAESLNHSCDPRGLR